MTDNHNPYATLGVDPTASPEEVSRAFRRAIRHAHPDHHGDAPADHTAITNLVEAWHTIGDPHRRADFDRTDDTSQNAMWQHPARQGIGHTARVRPTLLARLFFATTLATAAFLTILFVIAMSQSG
jgi:DnaJ-class molecular chaperone